MQTENAKEYELIRQEISEVKQCATQYIGFSFGGSGFALFGLGVYAKAASPLVFFYTPLALSVVATLVLYILYYKFNSHNRLAGYCGLLGVERWRRAISGPDLLFVWESCMAKIADGDTRPWTFLTWYSGLPSHVKSPLFERRIRQFVARRTENRLEWRRGLRTLVGFFTGKHITKESWMYPLWVTVPFVVIIGIFVAIPCYIAADVLLEHYSAIRGGDSFVRSGVTVFSHDTVAAMLVLLLALSFHTWTWRILFGKLYHLMEGDATVKAYKTRLKVIRGNILVRYGIIPIYVDSGTEDE